MQRDVLIGTYTWRDAEGIYRARFDDETGEFETLELAVHAENPAFLATRGDMLYAVNEQRDGGVSAFRRDRTDLTLVNIESSGGSLPCHLAVGPDWVAVANYGSGNVTLFPTATDGRLLPMSDSRQHQGSGTNPTRQQRAHAHEVYRCDTSMLVVPDLGTDKVHRYAVEGHGLRDNGFARLTPGSGPRHVERHPALPLLYVLNELGNTVNVLTWPEMTLAQSIGTLPEGFSAESTTAEVHIAPGGRSLYASNRGHDSIVSFTINADGRLASPSWVPTHGHHPRYFCLDPSGNWLLVVNQDSDNVVVYGMDAGRPTEVVCESEAPTPVCLLFV